LLRFNHYLVGGPFSPLCHQADRHYGRHGQCGDSSGAPATMFDAWVHSRDCGGHVGAPPPRRSLAAGEIVVGQPPSWPSARARMRPGLARPAQSVVPKKGEAGQGRKREARARVGRLGQSEKERGVGRVCETVFFPILFFF
jgi:hypothetical protein